MLNTAFFKPANVLIIGVIALIFVHTLGRFFGAHVEKTAQE